MSLDNLATSGGEWLKGDGPESDIVISTRMRLARNSDQYTFPTVASLDEKIETEEHLREAILQAKIIKDMRYVNLMTVSPVDALFLVERHLISREHAEGKGDRAVAFGANEVISVMVNEEDHLRIQVVRSGFQLDETWSLTDSVDDALGEYVDYAFSPRLGYLTACPSNLGTGMRASVMVHLPGLVMAKQIEKVFHAVSKINLAVRGLYGEGTQASGNFYQISNQATLGRTEKQILDNLRSVVPQIVSYERKARDTLVSQSKLPLEDRIWRAYGMLKTSRTITSQEVAELLSAVRLGVNLVVLKEPEMKLINELFILTQPAHLQKLKGRTLDAPERDVARAEFIRQKLGSL
jgi:protein arginine kinase